jgi:DNA-binding response OmpR family regulator
MVKRHVKILLVEDDHALRSATEVVLRREGYDVRARADGRDLEQQVRRFLPDLAILDVRLPVGPDGHEMGRFLRYLDLPVMFLTSADSLADRLAGFDVGADDYLVKPFPMEELLARTEALLRRCGKLDTGPREVGELVIDEKARSVTRTGHPIDLTRTEFELLSALSRRPGQVLSKSQLVGQVWGFGEYGENLVEVHVSALRQKLERHGPRLVQTVRGVGYMLRP